MKRFNWKRTGIATLGLGLMLATAPLAMAQESLPPAPDGQSSSNANEAGSIDTSQSMPGTTTTTTTTTTAETNSDYQADDAEPLPNTGGEPLLFLLAGSTLIAGGWMWRRKMVAGEN